VHFRGGDFYKNQNKYGVLRSDYYLSALNIVDPFREKLLTVVTDDVENAKATLKTLNPDMVLGPNHLNEWETLKLMSCGGTLITSNSTFSWWGGRLALAGGAQVYIPRPWLNDPKTGVQDAFEHPEFKLISSIF
jgi:hypothetical protein